MHYSPIISWILSLAEIELPSKLIFTLKTFKYNLYLTYASINFINYLTSRSSISFKNSQIATFPFHNIWKFSILGKTYQTSPCLHTCKKLCWKKNSHMGQNSVTLCSRSPISMGSQHCLVTSLFFSWTSGFSLFDDYFSYSFHLSPSFSCTTFSFWNLSIIL